MAVCPLFELGKWPLHGPECSDDVSTVFPAAQLSTCSNA
jgi:hypothetical protein